MVFLWDIHHGIRKFTSSCWSWFSVNPKDNVLSILTVGVDEVELMVAVGGRRRFTAMGILSVPACFWSLRW